MKEISEAKIKRKNGRLIGVLIKRRSLLMAFLRTNEKDISPIKE